MEIYQRIVLGIAIVLLIGAYVMIFFTLVNNKSQWPPSVAKCPDYWVYDNVNNSCKRSDYNKGDYTYKNYPSDTSGLKLSDLTRCDKYKWANENGISWDGLSYGISLNCP